MTTLLHHPAEPATLPAPEGVLPFGEVHMYAIVFDMDTDALRTHYGASYNNACTDIRKVLLTHGFKWQQGSTYFGGEAINAVTCVLAAMDLARKFSWFAASVRDIRMLRIEEQNDLMPAVQSSSELRP